MPPLVAEWLAGPQAEDDVQRLVEYLRALFGVADLVDPAEASLAHVT